MKKILLIAFSLIALCSLVPYALGVTKSFQVNTASGGSLTVSLVSYYQLVNPNDYYGPNNLTNNGSVTFGSGIVSSSAVFGGANYLGMNADISTSTSFSVAFWVFIPDSSNHNGLFLQNGAGGACPASDGIGIGIGGFQSIAGAFTGNIAGRGLIVDDGCNAWLSLGTGGAAGTGITFPSGSGWSNIIITYNGTTWNAYLNSTSTGNSPTTAFTTPTANFWIGRGMNNATDFYTPASFKIAEVGWWNKVLSANERTDLYNAGAGQTMITTGSVTKHKIILISFEAKLEHFTLA